MHIPFVDLKAQYMKMKPEIDSAIQGVLDSCKFVLGPDVKLLETEIAQYCGTQFAIGVASGTDALLLSLLACGVEQGDEVLTTPFTFIATTEAISKINANIVFIDIDPLTYTIDAEKIRQYIEENCRFDANKQQLYNIKTNNRVKAIIPVHLYGHPADMSPIMEIAKEYNLKVVEDCAQAIGARYKVTKTPSHKAAKLQGHQSSRPQSHKRIEGQRECQIRDSKKGESRIEGEVWKTVGSMGDAGCFSFFPSKNLGCYGDGGMIVTSDPEIAEKVQILHVHGCKRKYYHEIDGFNSRLDSLQAAVLRVKLKYLEGWNNARREKACAYSGLLQQSAVLQGALYATPDEADYARHVFYAYTIRIAQRNELQRYLKEQGIPSMIYYPVPLHLQEVYASLGLKQGSFPVSEQYAQEVLSLPIYPELTQEQQEWIAEKMTAYF